MIPRAAGELVDRAPRGPDEPRPQQQVLGRVAGDRELGKEDEVGAGLAGLVEAGEDLAAIAVEVADDGVDLCERESHRPGRFSPLGRKLYLLGLATPLRAAL